MLSLSSRRFSTHVKVAIMGAGTGGVSVSSQMMRSGKYKPGDITIFDPSSTHVYQPALTMLGGSVIGNNEHHVRK
jgi:sulfide:quinone oxidoreductase